MSLIKKFDVQSDDYKNFETIKYVYGNHEKFGVDKDLITTGGGSGGGWTIMLAGMLLA